MSDRTAEPVAEQEEQLRRRKSKARRRSRYDRPRSYISWFGVGLGIVLGLVGGFYYTWILNPAEEFDTAPWQLTSDDRARYVVAIMLDYAQTSNLGHAIEQLVTLDLGDDPIQAVADISCDLARTGYVNSTSGLRAIRVMMSFYQSQGKTGCADNIITVAEEQTAPVIQITVPTPTLVPPATKTPTPPGPARPSPTPPVVVIPTGVLASRFEIVQLQTFCTNDARGVIEVRVLAPGGDGIPGQPVRVRWDGGESIFFTGLKPERGADYADFQMDAGLSYIIDMPGLSDPSPTPLVASSCFTESGDESLTSYQVWFRSN